MATTYGQALPDSEHLVNDHAQALIDLLPTFSSFLAIRANLEREYARKLSEAAGKARSQAVKDALARGGGGGSNTLEAAYASVLENADLAAREHARLGDALQLGVIDPLGQAGTKLDTVRKKHHHFGKELVAERDRANDRRDKAKQKYFDACEALEQARQKKAAAAGKGDPKAAEKADRAWELAQEDMLIAKNTFLLATQTANTAKTRRFATDLPALHDDFQLLESSTIHQLVQLLTKYAAVDKDSLARQVQLVDQTEAAVATIDVEADQAAFMNLYSAQKLQGWEVPRDLGFEECPTWHDTDDMSTTPASTVFLQNIKAKAALKLQQLSPLIESKRRELSNLRNLAAAYQADPNLGDAGAVLENLFDLTRQVTLLEIDQSERAAEVELIDETLGEDAGTNLKLHKFKAASFVTPAACAVCGGSVWGKGVKCGQCGIAVHPKCENKVPAGCGSKAASPSVSRTGSRRLGHRNASSISSPPTASPSSAFASTSSLPPPRTPAPIPEAPATPAHTATMLYAYEAQTAFELSLAEAEVVEVVEDEDEAGWRKVRSGDGRVGLVPNSYLEVGGAVAGGDGVAEGGGEGEEVGGEGGRVTALFDYEAQGPDELSIRVGEGAELTATGAEYGDGWAEATKDGLTGLLPLSYLRIE